jgi:hypothetical protein
MSRVFRVRCEYDLQSRPVSGVAETLEIRLLRHRHMILELIVVFGANFQWRSLGGQDGNRKKPTLRSRHLRSRAQTTYRQYCIGS